jgi:hypothetical protein
MIFHNIQEIQDIQYPFLRKIALKLFKNYSLEKIYINSNGELDFTFKGVLTEEDIQTIMNIITPKGYGYDDYTISSLDYYSSEKRQKTIIYSIDNIDYRNIELMKVQLSKQLLDAIITAYNKENDPIEASDIDTLVLGVPFIKVNNTLIEWTIVNLGMQ